MVELVGGGSVINGGPTTSSFQPHWFFTLLLFHWGYNGKPPNSSWQEFKQNQLLGKLVPNCICKTLSSCRLETQRSHFGEVVAALLLLATSLPWSVASHAGWSGRLYKHEKGRVVELEGPGLLGQQGRAVEPHTWWPGRLDQQSRNFNWSPWF